MISLPHSGSPRRVFVWSDLHVDFEANFKLVEQLSRQDFRHDVLLLAGDVSSKLTRLMQTLKLLKERFAEVAFVPGNHDLWLAAGDPPDSLAKLHALRAGCRDTGVRTDPFEWETTGLHVGILPLLSWYLKPEEGEGSLYLPKPGEDPDLHMWADNSRIKWPAWSGVRTPAEYFLSLNAGRLADPASAPSVLRQVTISFSHFLPRIELVFADWEGFQGGGPPGGNDRAPAFNFTRVAGCRQLDDLLREHGSNIHLYGHQHRNRDRVIDGIRYVSHCLGYPAEWSEDASEPPRKLPLELDLKGWTRDGSVP